MSELQDAYNAGTKKSEEFFSPLDFTKIGALSGEARTFVRINAWDLSHKWGGSDDVLWMKLAAADLTSLARQNQWMFRAHLGPGYVDFEHSRGVIISMMLVGVTFTDVRSNNVEAVGWIDVMEGEHFRVPGPGYDPTTDPETEPCTYEGCKNEPKHFIVDYICKPNPALFKKVAGRKVTINFRPYDKDRDGK